MGQSVSTLKEDIKNIKDIDDVASLLRPRRANECQAHLDLYLKCVEGHKDGLTEGDDCSAEADVYKKCRNEVKARNTPK